MEETGVRCAWKLSLVSEPSAEISIDLVRLGLNIDLELVVLVLLFAVVGSVKLERVHFVDAVERADLHGNILTFEL